MKDTIGFLTKTDLFAGILPEDIDGLIGCLAARVKKFSRNDLIVEEGSRVYDAGIILEGTARSIKEDGEGRTLIISLLRPASEIGVILAASKDHRSPVSVQALEDSTVLELPFDRVIRRCAKNCLRHEVLLRNYMNIVAEKGLLLHERIDCLLKPTLRGKVIACLTRISQQTGSSEFIVPFDRNAMAEYLNTDRSALSRELSRMKREGIIDYRKDRFILLR